jgi:hypothetical protein
MLASHTHTWIDIHDWLSIMIISFALKETKLALTTIFNFFQDSFTHKIYHLSTKPIKLMFFEIIENI